MSIKNYSIIHILKNRADSCDHEWHLINRDNSKDINDWRCRFCFETNTTYGPLKEHKEFIGEF